MSAKTKPKAKAKVEIAVGAAKKPTAMELLKARGIDENELDKRQKKLEDKRKTKPIEVVKEKPKESKPKIEEGKKDVMEIIEGHPTDFFYDMEKKTGDLSVKDAKGKDRVLVLGGHSIVYWLLNRYAPEYKGKSGTKNRDALSGLSKDKQQAKTAAIFGAKKDKKHIFHTKNGVLVAFGKL